MSEAKQRNDDPQHAVVMCDCLNYCGDDPWLEKGKATPCEHFIERRKSRTAMTNKFAYSYVVSAGKFESDGEENCKVAGAPLRSFEDAMDRYNELSSYHWVKINVYNSDSALLCTIT